MAVARRLIHRVKMRAVLLATAAAASASAAGPANDSAWQWRERLVGTFRDRDRDGLLVFLVGMVSFRIAAAAYFLADLLVPAAPVVHLAGPTTNATRLESAFPPSRAVCSTWPGDSPTAAVTASLTFATLPAVSTTKPPIGSMLDDDADIAR